MFLLTLFNYLFIINLKTKKVSMISQSTPNGQLWNTFKARYAPSRLAMLQSGQLKIGEKTMNFVYKTKGQRPPNGYTLIFGLHGGGGCPAETNNQQYNNHKNLYDAQLPDGSIWFTPRSIEDVWDMWFQDYMEDFILEFIRAFNFNDMIDINKVFITGYSAGGDGVYHLAPRMADHLAGAAMMAGHPNGINFLNVRNIAFSIQIGQEDNAYNRRNEAIKNIRMLNQMGQNYGGFKHQSKVHPGKPHWMGKQDAKVFDWLCSFTRNPYPDVILHKECPRKKNETFYYLRLGQNKKGKNDEQTVVLKQGNTIKIYSNRKITVLVNSQMVNPAETVTIMHNNKVTSQRKMQYQQAIVEKSLLERIDPYFIFQDQFVSDPPALIDIKATMCELFSITQQEKDAEYEKSLPMKPEQTPANFNKSLTAAVQRKKPLTIGAGGLQILNQANRQVYQPPPQVIPQTTPIITSTGPVINTTGMSYKQSIGFLTSQNDQRPPQQLQQSQPQQFGQVYIAGVPATRITQDIIQTSMPQSNYQYLSQPQQVQPQPQQNANNWANWSDTQPTNQPQIDWSKQWQQQPMFLQNQPQQYQQQGGYQGDWSGQGQFMQQGQGYVGQWQMQPSQQQQFYPSQQYYQQYQQEEYQPQVKAYQKPPQ